MLKIIFLFFPLLVFSQTKIIFTYVDYEHDEVRAAICNEDGSSRYDLGFNKTYLPVWFQDNILFNSDTFIWKCDTTGENLTKMNEGYRVSVSNDKKKYAFYNLQGIAVANDSGKIIKQMMVDAWEEVGITWSKEDSMISYYNLEKEKCNLFNLNNDSIIIFGDSIYHPLWNKNHNKILYNKKNSENKYNILV